MKIEGVVVLYNPDKNLKDNIKTYLPYLDKLYLIDNTSNADYSKKYEKNDKICYVPLKENLGIAYALNYAAKMAIEDKSDWLLTMDQDSYFEDNGLEKMIDFLQNIKKNKKICEVLEIEYNKIGVLSPFHVTTKSKDAVNHIKGIDYPEEVMTSGNLINLDAYKKVNGFKEWFFIDCVDFDYCFNLKNHGYDVLTLNCAHLIHNLGDIIEKKFLGKTVYTDNHNAIRWYYMSRNRNYINDLYYDTFPAFCNYQKKCTKREFIKIWLYEKNKIKKTRAILRGWWDYKHGVKGKYKKK